MNTQRIDEKISVNLVSNLPTSVFWRGRDYKITKIGFHHDLYEGKNLIHIFSVLSDNLFFKLKFDTKNLEWRLLETYDDTFGH